MISSLSTVNLEGCKQWDLEQRPETKQKISECKLIPLERSAGLWRQQRWLLVYLERLLYCTHSPQFHAWIVVCIITQQIFVSPTPVIQNSKLQSRWLICSIWWTTILSTLQHLCAIIDMMLWPTLKDWHRVGLILHSFSSNCRIQVSQIFPSPTCVIHNSKLRSKWMIHFLSLMDKKILLCLLTFRWQTIDMNALTYLETLLCCIHSWQFFLKDSICCIVSQIFVSPRPIKLPLQNFKAYDSFFYFSWTTINMSSCDFFLILYHHSTIRLVRC
jgi:hypothetical protein